MLLSSYENINLPLWLCRVQDQLRSRWRTWQLQQWRATIAGRSRVSAIERFQRCQILSYMGCLTCGMGSFLRSRGSNWNVWLPWSDQFDVSRWMKDFRERYGESESEREMNSHHAYGRGYGVANGDAKQIQVLDYTTDLNFHPTWEIQLKKQSIGWCSLFSFFLKFEK